ncbi:hypothetical protein [Streptomonospora wellingtoniae]|uniref:Uncharacterized protein n=1 Tax=Streptomonospora wellingtoniae TaxID=3075544 RepID=A0ABU2KW88_9ACTN|nr:hypothetical protein [Streptomonospora sp. DSM 45055]MDT0303549.1 hypothetical protein [Streptomonospora sp. DSM 45055]
MSYGNVPPPPLPIPPTGPPSKPGMSTGAQRVVLHQPHFQTHG